MSALKAYARQLEWKRIMQEQMAKSPRTTGSSHWALVALRRTLGQPAPPIAPAAPVLPAAATSPPAAFWADLASEYVRGIQRAAPAVEAALPATPAPAPRPATSRKPTMPREVVIMRDFDNRITHAMVGDQQFRFQRDRDGRIERAEGDRHVVNFKRGLDGYVVGALLQPKEPK